MCKKGLLLCAVIGMLMMYSATGLFAGTEVGDEILLDNPVYEKHTKGIVEFTHKKHAVDYVQKYPQYFKNGCGDCHHDEAGKPLALKAGDDVQSCAACHKETGKAPKGIDKAEKIKRFHKNALHENCKSCHKAFNKGEGIDKKDPKAAPVSCKTCHPSKKK